MTTLAPSSLQQLPSLVGVPIAYEHEVRGELLYKLCAELTRRGLGSPAIFSMCGGSAVRFAEEAIRSSFDPETDELLRRNVEYHFTVSDSLDRYGELSALGDARLAVTMDCGNAGYLKLGKALAWLEQREAGLAEAFYWVLLWSLYRVVRVYDHTDAQRYEEGIREYLEAEPSEAQTLEFPEVQKTIPICLRNSEERDDARSYLRRLRNHTDVAWVNRVLMIHRLSRLHVRSSDDLVESGQYNSPPVPCVLIAFEDNDAVVACFDEEAQTMLEGAPEPSLVVAFRVGDPAESDHALRAVRRFLAIHR